MPLHKNSSANLNQIIKKLEFTIYQIFQPLSHRKAISQNPLVKYSSNLVRMCKDIL